MKIEVFTDGSATVPTKPGGWAYVLVIDDEKHAECSGHAEGASNNDMELEAAIQGLAAALNYIVDNNGLGTFASLTPPKVYLCSDSQLVLGWADGTYRFKQPQEEKKAKYKTLVELVRRMKVETKWIKGHSGHEHNERCDKLANEARTGITKKNEMDEAKARGETLIGTKKSGTMCVWYKGKLKVVDLETNIVEDFKREVHGNRGSMLEIREEKSR
jgi:ribonuclease HI